MSPPCLYCGKEHLSTNSICSEMFLAHAKLVARLNAAPQANRPGEAIANRAGTGADTGPAVAACCDGKPENCHCALRRYKYNDLIPSCVCDHQDMCGEAGECLRAMGVIK